MGLFSRKKKVVEPTVTPLEALNKQIMEYNKKEHSIKSICVGYDRNVNKIIENIKKEPENTLLVNMAKKQLTMIITKKLMYQKYMYMIQACLSILTTKRNELIMTNGTTLMDPEFIKNMSDLLGQCDEGLQSIDMASTLDQLEAQFDSFMEMNGLGAGDDVQNEVARQVEQTIAQVLNPTPQQAPQSQTETQTQTQTSNQEPVDQTIEALRKKYGF